MPEIDIPAGPHRRALDMTRDIPRSKYFRARHALPDQVEFETRPLDRGIATVSTVVPPPVQPRQSTRDKLAMLWSNLRAGRFRRG